MILKPGDNLSHYRLVEKIGEGGMGIVYKAHDSRLNRHVALKILKPDLMADVKRSARFLREARVVAAVSHPNIATIHEIAEADGITFIVMELVEGRSLRVLVSEGVLTVTDAVQIALQMAEALCRAHQARIVHRDLKPENVVISSENHAKILDFGLAKWLTDEAEPPPAGAEDGVDLEPTISRPISMGGRVLGTVSYMSPEQIRGDPLDVRSDIFSFGVTLYEMLTGRLPFVERNIQATLGLILVAEPEPPSRINPGLPAELERLVLRCLEKEPIRRYQDGGDLAAALKSLPPGSTTTGAREGLAQATIAVFPFSVRGNLEFSYLADGMVDLLSTKLDGVGEIRTVDPQAILCCVHDDASSSDPDGAAAIARRFGASLFVMGNVLAVGTRLHLDAFLYESSGEHRVLARAASGGEGAQIFEMVDHLTAELLARRIGGPGARLSRIAALATDSFPALRAYLEGESEMRAMRRATAVEAYRRAVAADPSFALAWYRLAVAALWCGQSDLALQAARHAVAQSGRLSERDRLLLSAFDSALLGKNDEADRRFRTIVGNFPDDVEAWYQLGELGFHCGPLHGRPMTDSLDAWDRLLLLEPKHLGGLVHRGVIEASSGEMEKLGRTVSRILDLSPESEAAVWMKTCLAFAGNDPGSRRAALSDLRNASDYIATFAAQFVAFLGEPDATAECARLVSEPIRSAEVRALGHRMSAHLEVSAGRWSEAKQEIERAGGLEGVAAAEHGALLSASLILDLPAAEIETARTRLENLKLVQASVAHPATWLAPHEGLHDYLRLYLLGMLEARAGRIREAITRASELESAPAPEGPGACSLIHDLALSVRAHAAWSAGEPDKALALLEETKMEARFDQTLWSPFYSQAFERWSRAELLLHSDRLDEALAWYGSFDQNCVYNLMYETASYYRRAQIRERLGDNAMAAAHYARFAELWHGCDPAMRPRVDEARRLAASLGR